jgi:acetylornithine deacetylase/succinyl-diaminopimelate desuccinylase-like protein
VQSLTADLEAAARIGADPRGGVSRFAWSPELAEANAWLAGRLTALGLEVDLDSAGNVLGRWEAGEGKGVLLGSHLDTVPNGGRYDGALGVLAALDVVRRLKAEGVEPARPLWVVSFNDEEGARFQTGMLGSRAFCGECDFEDWERRGIAEAMAAAGFDFGRLADARFLGEANHAGTTPMELRRDALAGAARAVLALRDEARARDDTTANVGMISAEPGGFNVVPGAAEITIDVRSPSIGGFAGLEPLVRGALERIAAEEELGLELRETHRKQPVALDPELQDRLEEAAREEGATTLRLASGAGHDAMVLAHHVPAAMLFVPSRGGLSHTPDEYSSPEHCELGARVLARTVRSLVR